MTRDLMHIDTAPPAPPPARRAEPLARNRLFQTRDLDEARAIVAAKFCDHRLDIASQADRFDARHHRAEGRAASLNYIRYGADVRIDPGELGSFYLIQIPLAGRAEIDNGGGRIASGPGRGSVLNPHRHTRMRWHAGCAQLLLQIDARALNQQAARLVNRQIPPRPVTFATAVDASQPKTAAWLRRLRLCVDLAEHRALFAAGRDHSGHAATQALAEEQLITDFLQSQPSDLTPLLDAPHPGAATPHVRRAIQFIQDHLAEPITVGQIAAAVGVSVRGLQLGFQADLGLSPMQVLRDMRLDLARELIQQAGSARTLAQICAQAGIGHLGRFSAAYKQRFGETPSQTRQAL